MSIGIFDSGVGGISVLKEIRKILPNEKIVYVGDIARVPYGEKTPEQIVKFSMEISNFLVKQGVELIVIACNTATAYSLKKLQSEFSIPVVGVINSGVKVTVDNTKTGKVAVIATKATVNSGKYEEEILKYYRSKKSKNKNKFTDINVFMQACPLLTISVEQGIIKGKIIDDILKEYISPFANKIDTLTLGCTHFPILKEEITNLYPNIMIVDPAIETANKVRQILLSKNELFSSCEKTIPTQRKGEINVYLTKKETSYAEENKLEEEKINDDELICVNDGNVRSNNILNYNNVGYDEHKQNFLKVANIFLEDIGEKISNIKVLNIK